MGWLWGDMGWLWGTAGTSWSRRWMGAPPNTPRVRGGDGVIWGGYGALWGGYGEIWGDMWVVDRTQVNGD